MSPARRRIKDDEELMRETGIKKTVSFSISSSIRDMERKILGPSWGKKREKMKGWPR